MFMKYKLTLYLILMIFISSLNGQVSENVYVPWQTQKVCQDKEADIWTLCGHTSVEMVLSKFENREPLSTNILNYNNLIREYRGQDLDFCYGSGTPNPNHLIWLLESLGYDAKWYGSSGANDLYETPNNPMTKYRGDINESDLISYLNSDIPILVQVHTNLTPSTHTHWMVLRKIEDNAGDDNDWAYLNDPGTEFDYKGTNRKFKLSDFLASWQYDNANNKSWNTYNIAIVIKPKSKPINGNLDIYAGPKASPYNNVKIWCYPPDGNSSYTITNFKINGFPKTIQSTSTFDFASGKAYFTLNFNNVISGTSNGPYTFEFDAESNNKTTHFYSDKLYFLDMDDYADENIQALDNWSKKYIGQGTRNGLFKGSKNTGSWLFDPSGNLTKGQACKIIVNAMLRLDMISGINSNMPGGLPPNDASLNSNSEFKPFYYTLINNYNISIIPDNGITFDFNQSITTEEFCWLISKAFSLPSTQNVKSKISKLVFSRASNTELEVAVRQVSNIFVPIKDVSGNEISAETIASMFKWFGTGALNVDCKATIKRSAMAKVLTNIFIWKANQLGISGNVRARMLNVNSLSEYFILGDKLESTDYPTGNTPSISPQILSNYTINDNQSLTISHASDVDAANNGIPLYFYWTANGGDTLESLSSNFRSVKFVPGTVTQPTVFKLYTQCGNTNGKIREYYINVTVNPTDLSTTTATPTNQAANVQITNATSSTLNISWTRGNGQYCLVTCTPSSANISPPQPNNIYIGNTNFALAGLVNGDTRIIYNGTGTSVSISNLTPNTDYKIAVYEFNGNTAPTVKYLTTPLAFNTGYTLPSTNTVSNFTWNTYPVVNGVAVLFTSSSQNASTYAWSVSPSATIATATSVNTYITFPSVGTYNVTLVASNITTGQTDTKTIAVTVLDAATNLPDLVVQNIAITPASVIAGQSITVNCTAAQTNVAVPTLAAPFYLQYYISTDQLIDASDWASGQEVVILNTAYTKVVSHALTVPNSYSGNYYILIKIDNNSAVVETNEGNNISNIVLPVVTAKCDLTILSGSITPNTMRSGNKFNINLSIKNIGQRENTRDVGIDYWVSKDNILDKDDYQISYSGNISPSLIGANQTYAFNQNNIVSPNFNLSGNYYLIATVDWNFIKTYGFDWNDELDETNNQLIIPITFTNPNQPTVQVSNIKITNKTTNSLTLSWTNGNSNKRIVVGRKVNVPHLPSDDSAYTANANWSSASLIKEPTSPTSTELASRVLYNGTGNSVNITGLSADTTYYFSVFEYNDISTTSKDYLQNGQLNTAFCVTKKSGVATGWNKVVGQFYTVGGIFQKSPDSLFVNSFLGLSYSVDSGNSWILNRYINQDYNSYSNTQYGFGYNKTANKIYLLNDKKIFSSIDNGISWSVVASFDGQIASILPIDGTNIIYASMLRNSNTTNDSKIIKSIDAGATWQIIYTPSQNRYIKSVYFINSTNGYLLDDIGNMFRTSNGGTSWTTSTVSSTGVFGISSLYFIDATNGFCMNYSGLLYSTNDGGVSWSLKFNSGITGGIYPQFNFTDKQNGFVALGRKFLRTTNGGSSWQLDSIVYANDAGIVGTMGAVNANSFVMLNDKSVFTTNTSGLVNSITITSVLPLSLCPNSTISLNYTLAGTFSATNIIKLELSDVNGLFLTPIILDTLTSNVNGTITGTLPANITSSTKYRVRLTSTNPSVLSSPSANLQFTKAPIITISAPLLNSYSTLAGSVVLAASPSGGTFQIDGVTATSFNPATLSVGEHTVLYTYTSGGCTYTSQKIVNVFVPRSVTIGALSTTNLCAGANLKVPYALTGIFDSTNVFTSQLSDASGSFTNPVSLASFNSNQYDTILSPIPATTPAGSGYRIRIVNTTDTFLISSLSVAITVNAGIIPTAQIITVDTIICSGNTAFYAGSGTNIGSSPTYQWLKNGVNVGSNSQIFTTNDISDGDVIQLKVTGNGSCAVSPYALSDIKQLVVTNKPDTPAIAHFDNTLVSTNPEGNQWYLNGTIIIGATDQFYEPITDGIYQVRTLNSPCVEIPSSSYSFSATTIFTFTGNGNWSVASNWLNNMPPPLELPLGALIIIDPLSIGECVLDVNQKLLSGSSLRVVAGKRFRIPGNIMGP